MIDGLEVISVTRYKCALVYMYGISRYVAEMLAGNGVLEGLLLFLFLAVWWRVFLSLFPFLAVALEFSQCLVSQISCLIFMHFFHSVGVTK